MDRLTKWVDQEVQLRLVAVDVLETAREIAHEQHQANGRAAEMIAQSIIGSLLLACDLKTMTTLSLQVLLEGPLRMVCADATPEALVRAMAPKDDLDEFDPSLKLHPYRLVVRRVGARGVQYQSVVEGRTDTLAQSLASYVRQSDQQPCALGIQVATDPEGQLTRAFGYLLQGFPDTREAVLQACEIALSFADPFTIEEPGHEWLMRSLALREWDPLQERHPTFFCPCTRERAARSLVALGAAELEEAAAGQEELEVFCDFCRRRYTFSDSELLDLAFEAQSVQDEREVAEAVAASESSITDGDSFGEDDDSAAGDEEDDAEEDDADNGPIKSA